MHTETARRATEAARARALPWPQRVLQRARLACFVRGHFRLYDLLRVGGCVALLCGEPMRTHAELVDEHMRALREHEAHS